MSIYQQMTERGIPCDNHESDLYVLATSEAREILVKSGHSFTTFTSQIDGKVWYDVPFAFDPWWEARRS